MDNVILWIKSNNDVIDAYKRTKADCNYQHKSDNDFLMFLLEAATNVLSIVHQFAPQITCLPNEGETTPPETLITREDEINLEKLDKQLRINIVCPELENNSADNGAVKDQAPPPPPPPPPTSGGTEPSSTPGSEAKIQNSSTSALQDISDHVNELESVLESLNKSSPLNAPLKTVFRPLSSRQFIDSLKPSEKNILNSMKSNQPPHPESIPFSKPMDLVPSAFSKSTEAAFKKSTEAAATFNKFKAPSVPNMMFSKRNNTSSVRSSPNVTISTESQLNLAAQSPKQPTIIKPVPIIAKSPDMVEQRTAVAPPRDRSATPPTERDTISIDVVNPDRDSESRSPQQAPSPQQQQAPCSPQIGGTKRKADCLNSGSPPDQDNMQCSPEHQIKEEIKTPEQQHQQSELPSIPSETELTQQLMSVIQSTLSQQQSGVAQSISCQECGLIFANEMNLHRHMLTHIETENIGEDQFNCPTCAFKTPRRQTLTKHINTVHSRDRSSGILYCDQCEYKTPTKSHLRNHMLAHTGNRQYQCPHCTYNSNFSNALTRHMTMHSRELFESKVANLKP